MKPKILFFNASILLCGVLSCKTETNRPLKEYSTEIIMGIPVKTINIKRNTLFAEQRSANAREQILNSVEFYSANTSKTDLQNLLNSAKTKFDILGSIPTTSITGITIYSKKQREIFTPDDIVAVQLFYEDRGCIVHKFGEVINGALVFNETLTGPISTVTILDYEVIVRKLNASKPPLSVIDLGISSSATTNNDILLGKKLIEANFPLPGDETENICKRDKCGTDLNKVCLKSTVSNNWDCRKMEGLCLFRAVVDSSKKFGIQIDVNAVNEANAYIFRDSFLKNSILGRQYIQYYYKLGFVLSNYPIMGVENIFKYYAFTKKLFEIARILESGNPETIVFDTAFLNEAKGIINELKQFSGNFEYVQILNSIEFDLTRFCNKTREQLIAVLN